MVFLQSTPLFQRTALQFFFKQKKKKISSKVFKFEKRLDVIQLHKVKKPYTELGTLFLHPDFRGKGRGSLLSLARFKFMALWPERFDHDVVAEIRGKVDKDDNSIFWKYFSKTFLMKKCSITMK